MNFFDVQSVDTVSRCTNITYTEGRHEASFHPSVSSSIHPFVQSSICLVMVCLLRRGEERVDYRCSVAENNIY